MISIPVNSKIALSLGSIAVAGAIIAGATFALFSDTETSAGNVLSAGSLDLKIDSEAHYAGMVCTEVEPGATEWVDEDQDPNNNPRTELLGEPCVGTWELKDLEQGDTFVNLTDLKPGDDGENTISLHVFDNDAWGRIRVFNINDQDITCTEPESEVSPADDPECTAPSPSPGPGELSDKLNFTIWLDEGQIPGFQCANPATPSPSPGPLPCDPGEGDNVQQGNEQEFAAEAITSEPGTVDISLPSVLVNAAGLNGCTGDGHQNYGLCHGLASDGRLVGSVTYYFGVHWQIDPDAGNEIQTDSLAADISFDIEQHRNNPTPFD